MEKIDSKLSDNGSAGKELIPDHLITLQLQLELDLLKRDYKTLLAELFEKREVVHVQHHSVKELQAGITTLIQSIATLTERDRELSLELADKEITISEQSRKVQELYRQVDTVNIQLSEIYASEGWKLLSVYYRVRNGILPVGSRRQQGIKKAINWVRRKKSDNVTIKDHSQPAGNAYQLNVPIEPFEFPYYSHPKVSIIIPAHNGWEMNYQCLRSIRDNTELTAYEVIFADDVSTDETRNVEDYIKNIVHIRNEQNLGFLQNCNHAATFTRGEYLHFLNNDTKVTPGWLSSLVSLMEKDATIGMAGSKLVYPDGRLQEAGGIIWQDASGWNYGHKQDPEAPEYNYVKEVDYISGASIMIRKSIWEELGGFNEMYNPAYCEDSDLAFSIREKGYKVVYQPLSKVVHFEGFSHGTDNNPQGGLADIKSYQKINSAKFAEKWQPVLQQQFPNGVNPYWTRDRSHGKPTIVVIDHYVPHFDKDAGSRTTFQYLELFVELGMNVKFIGDNFYKHEPYTTILQQKGIEVLYGTYYAENWMKWLKDNDPYIDFVLLNRPHISIKYIDQLKGHMHGKIFYYTHDLHFHRELMEYEVSKDPEKLKSSVQWKEMEYSLFDRSDVVLTPTLKEKELIQPDFPGKPIEVMPAFFYPSIAEPIRDFKNRSDILFVGGFNHSPNIDAVRWFADEIMPLIREKNEEIRLIVVGSNAPQSITSLAAADVIIKGFVTDEELDLLYGSVRLAVIPLRFGGGLKGKTVEALARALPIVSTSFGIEGLEGIEAILPSFDTPFAFAEALTALYGDTGKLEALSSAATTYSRQYFTKEVAAVFFQKLFSINPSPIPEIVAAPVKTAAPVKQIITESPVRPIVADQTCPCCHSGETRFLRRVSEYNYYNCLTCESLFIDTSYLARIDEGFNIVKYEEGYWKEELDAAKQRSYGPALARMAEAIYYCKRPIKKFLDIGTGPGYFLDAVGKLLPDHADVFYGVELFPPDDEFRTRSKNYIVGDLGDLTDKFDCGICIEVVEHLTPRMVEGLLKKLADVSNSRALYIFNTGMPEFVLHEDIGYLDPVKRGHLVSYSVKAMSIMGGKYGFTAHRIVGKTWAFALEFFKEATGAPVEDIRDRIWHASKQNLEILSDTKMGETLKLLGMETSRAY